MNNVLKRTILITGANKGIGYGIAKSLAQNLSNNDTVILTSRNKDLGEKSRTDIIDSSDDREKVSSKLFYQQLDICDQSSRKTFLNFLSQNFNKIDVLVNNAGVMVKGNEFNTSVFDYTMPTNFFKTVEFTEEVLSDNLINKNGKIINVASTLGKMNCISSDALKKELLDSNLTVEKLVDLSARYRIAIEKSLVESEGWSQSCYSFSKLCLNLYTQILGKKKEILERGIQVYSCCPGWVRTDMGGPRAFRSIEEGIVTPLYLINLPHEINSDLQGKFFYDSKVTSIS